MHSTKGPAGTYTTFGRRADGSVRANRRQSHMSEAHPPIRVSNRLYGHFLGSRQVCRLLDLTVERPEEFFVGDAKRLLRDTFLVERDPAEAYTVFARILSDKNVAALLATVCLVARHLLQASRIPSFERPRILRTSSESGPPSMLEVRLAIPAVEQIPVSVFFLAYRHAIEVARQFARPENMRDLKGLVDALDEDFVQRATALSRGGLATVPFLREAFAREVPFFLLPGGYYQIGTGARGRLFSKGATDRDCAIGAFATANKTDTMLLMQENGIPVPRSLRASSVQDAVHCAEEIGFPVVVKPEDRDRNEGVTVDIVDVDGVATAFSEASKWSSKILVQERIPGNCQRLVTFRNKFVFGFCRHPKSVVGDGALTIEGLVRKANADQERKASHLRSKSFPLDTEALECLAKYGWTPEDVPEEGEIVYLRSHQSRESGGHNETITERVHAANIALVERISRLLRLESAGFDLISTDPGKPWYETGAVITEINWMPEIGDNTAKAMLHEMFPDRPATVPVECFVGAGVALDAGRRRHSELARDGVSSVLVSYNLTIGAAGKPVDYEGRPGQFDRSMMVLRDPGVEAVVLAVETDELLRTGLPVPTFSAVHVMNGQLLSESDLTSPPRVLGDERLKRIFRSR